MHLLLTLLIGHLFADFPLQTNALARYKSKHVNGVLIHVLIYTTITALLIEQWATYWPLILLLGLAHFLVDVAKPRLCPLMNELVAFVFDQALHLFSMVALAWFAHWWWPVAPQGIVPHTWLLWLLIAATLPALVVTYWVWATHSNDSWRGRHGWLSLFYPRALLLEQRFGQAVIGFTFWLLMRPH